MNTSTVVSVILVAAAGAGGYFWYTRSGGKEESRYETSPVERGRIVAKVTASGTLSALVTVQVGSQVSGRLQQIFVDFNSRVTKGQLIAQIDPQLFQANLEQARANRLVAEASLVKARVQAQDAQRQFERSKSLGELIPQSEMETAEANAHAADAQVEVARGSLEQARASANQAEINLGYTKILSPIDGVVISRAVDPGQTVAASLAAPTLFTIAEDLTKMQVDTNVAESDVGKLDDGMAATFTVDAYPGERFRGRVRQIRNAPLVVQNVVTYDAVIDVENPELKLKPGMTANVTIEYAKRSNVLKVQNAALRFRPSGDLAADEEPGKRPGRPSRSSGPASMPSNGDLDPLVWKTVWVLRQERAAKVRIRTGLTDGTATEVLEGALTEGDAVLIEASGGEPRRGGGGGFGMRRGF